MFLAPATPTRAVWQPIEVHIIKNSIKTSSRHKSIIFHHYVLGNAQKKEKAFQHFPVLKPCHASL